MKHTIFCILGLLIVGNTSMVFPSSLVFKHNGTAVFASLSNGTMLVNNPSLVTNSTTPVNSQGLIIKHTNVAKLWTISDVVNINSEMAPAPSTLPSGALMLSFSADAMTTLADDAIYNGNPTGDQVLTLTKEDYYLEGMVKENDGAGLPLTNYYGFGDGRIEYTGATEKKRFYIKDHLGSTREVINEDGTPIERVLYDAYGKMTEETILAGTELNAKDKFTGKEYDKEGENSTYGVQGIQLNYFGARYYDPDVGMWTSTDSKDEFWNAYSYVGGDPINYYDGDGRGAESVNPLARLTVAAALSFEANVQTVYLMRKHNQSDLKIFIAANFAADATLFLGLIDPKVTKGIPTYIANALTGATLSGLRDGLEQKILTGKIDQDRLGQQMSKGANIALITTFYENRLNELFWSPTTSFLLSSFGGWLTEKAIPNPEPNGNVTVLENDVGEPKQRK